MAVLNAATRKALPASDYVFPTTKEYPIPDEEHGRAALSLGAKNDPGRMSTIRAAVHRRYPNIDQSEGGIKQKNGMAHGRKS